MKTYNAKCNKCKGKARLWHNGKWWCSFKQGFGDFNLIGECDAPSSARRRNNDK